MISARYCRKAAWGVPTEAQEMRVLAEWLDLAGVLWCHPRNEETSHRCQRVGVKKGTPDILVFTPPPNNTRVTGVAIELKRVKGSKLSKEQKQWLYDLLILGWLTRFAYGADEAISWLKELGYGVGKAP